MCPSDPQEDRKGPNEMWFNKKPVRNTRVWSVWGPILEPSLKEDTLGGLCCVDGQSGRSKVLKVEGEDVSPAPEGVFISETLFLDLHLQVTGVQHRKLSKANGKVTFNPSAHPSPTTDR